MQEERQKKKQTKASHMDGKKWDGEQKWVRYSKNATGAARVGGNVLI